MHLLKTSLNPPELGLWYQLDNTLTFKVVAMDADDHTIEIQYFDGTIEQWDADYWVRSDVIAIQDPEDWTGPFDEIEHDDLGYEELEISLRTNGNPIDRLD